MTRIPDDMSEIHAPRYALAWAASYGWIRDRLDLERTRERGDDVVILVEDDQWVRDLTGTAPLAAIVRVDRDLQVLTDHLEEFFARLSDLAEETGSR